MSFIVLPLWYIKNVSILILSLILKEWVLRLFSYLLALSQVGYLSASIRSVADARVGDTITHLARRAGRSLPGYEEATPMVFCGLFPVDADQYVVKQLYYYISCSQHFKVLAVDMYIARYPDLRDALEKLQLNDAALNVCFSKEINLCFSEILFRFPCFSSVIIYMIRHCGFGSAALWPIVL